MCFGANGRVDLESILDDTMRGKFQSLLEEYDRVFEPAFKGYNGAEGPFQAVVSMGPAQPPQRKCRVPQYSRDKLDELQQKFNDLKRKGVFVKPEDVGITVVFLNPSFLVKKRTGGFRLVTTFADVGRYSHNPLFSPTLSLLFATLQNGSTSFSRTLQTPFIRTRCPVSP